MRRRPGWSASSAPSSAGCLISTDARSGSSCAIAGSRPSSGSSASSALATSFMLFPRRSCRSATAPSSAACWSRRKALRPTRCTPIRREAEKIMRANPAVRSTFTMSGNAAFLGSNQAFLIAFLKPPSQRAPIEQVAGQLMGGIGATIPGTIAFLQPNPALEISTGATANAQGQFAYALSGIDANEVYATAGKMMAKMYRVSGIPVRELRSLQSHAEPAGRHSARPGEALRSLRDAHSYASARCLLAELQLPDQEGDRSIPGHPRSGRRQALGPGRPGQALHQER